MHNGDKNTVSQYNTDQIVFGGEIYGDNMSGLSAALKAINKEIKAYRTIEDESPYRIEFTSSQYSIDNSDSWIQLPTEVDLIDLSPIIINWLKIAPRQHRGNSLNFNDEGVNAGWSINYGDRLTGLSRGDITVQPENIYYGK